MFPHTPSAGSDAARGGSLRTHLALIEWNYEFSSKAKVFLLFQSTVTPYSLRLISIVKYQALQAVL